MSLSIITAQNYLKSHGMCVTEEWLSGCVDFFCSEASNRSKTSQELCAMVKNQWMLCDLQEISPGCLPPNLLSQVKMTLNGIYTLQMNFLIDIGTSAYQQIQKLTKVDMTNIETTDIGNTQQEPTSQRMFKLELTDGVQKIHGIEYRPMRNLNSGLIPGIKLQVKGPIDCRRGVLMMEEKHVTILGGEVDDMLEKYAYKNVLCKKIDLNCNFVENNSRSNNFTREPVMITNRPAAVSRDFIVNVQQNMSTINVNDLNDDMFSDNFDLIELDQVENQALNTSRSNANDRERNHNFIQEDIFIEDSYDDVFEDHYREPETIATPVIYPVQVSKNPFVYIKQLEDVQDDFKKGKTFVVKAQVFKVIGKLSLQKTVWVLKCTIVDGSGQLDVDMSSDILSELIEYTPDDMIKIKKQMSTKPELKQDMIKALDCAMNKIYNCDCLLHIKYEESSPTIIKMDPLAELHINQLIDRVNAVS